jgi:hypothetical protein
MMRRITLLLFVIVLVTACQKDAGDGGNSSIRGKVTKEIRLILDNPNTTQHVVPAADLDMYIQYGDHTSPDDRIQTNYDGEFEFLQLRPGKYTIYCFSKDTNSVAVNWDQDHMPIIRNVEITDSKQVVEVDEMVVFDQN